MRCGKHCKLPNSTGNPPVSHLPHLSCIPYSCSASVLSNCNLNRPNFGASRDSLPSGTIRGLFLPVLSSCHLLLLRNTQFWLREQSSSLCKDPPRFAVLARSCCWICDTSSWCQEREHWHAWFTYMLARHPKQQRCCPHFPRRCPA